MSADNNLEYPIDADSLCDVIKLLFDPALIAPEVIQVRDKIYSDLQKLPSTNVGPLSITFSNRFRSSDPEQGSGSAWVSIDIGDEGMEFSVGNHIYTPGVGGDTSSDTIFKCWEGGGSEGYLSDWLVQLKALDRDTIKISVSHEFQEADVEDELDATLLANVSSGPGLPLEQFRSLSEVERVRLRSFYSNAAHHPQVKNELREIAVKHDARLQALTLREQFKNDEVIVFSSDLSLQVGQMMAIYFENGPVKFADVAFDLVADLNLSLGELRPYLRGWYEGIRCWREDAGEPIDGMDSPEAVRGAISMIKTP